jgi:hypothetical protein
LRGPFIGQYACSQAVCCNEMAVRQFLLRPFASATPELCDLVDWAGTRRKFAKQCLPPTDREMPSHIPAHGLLEDLGVLQQFGEYVLAFAAQLMGIVCESL